MWCSLYCHMCYTYTYISMSCIKSLNATIYACCLVCYMRFWFYIYLLISKYDIGLIIFGEHTWCQYIYKWKLSHVHGHIRPQNLGPWVHGATHPGQCAKGCAITILLLDLMGFDQPLTVARRCSRSGTWIFLKNFHPWRPGRCHQPCFWPSLEYGEGILGMLRYTSAY